MFLFLLSSEFELPRTHSCCCGLLRRWSKKKGSPNANSSLLPTLTDLQTTQSPSQKPLMLTKDVTDEENNHKKEVEILVEPVNVLPGRTNDIAYTINEIPPTQKVPEAQVRSLTDAKTPSAFSINFSGNNENRASKKALEELSGTDDYFEIERIRSWHESLLSPDSKSSKKDRRSSSGGSSDKENKDPKSGRRLSGFLSRIKSNESCDNYKCAEENEEDRGLKYCQSSRSRAIPKPVDVTEANEFLDKIHSFRMPKKNKSPDDENDELQPIVSQDLPAETEDRTGIDPVSGIEKKITFDDAAIKKFMQQVAAQGGMSWAKVSSTTGGSSGSLSSPSVEVEGGENNVPTINSEIKKKKKRSADGFVFGYPSGKPDDSGFVY